MRLPTRGHGCGRPAHAARVPSAHQTARTGSRTRTTTLNDAAAARSPWLSAATQRRPPQKGHHSPVVACSGQVSRPAGATAYPPVWWSQAVAAPTATAPPTRAATSADPPRHASRPRPDRRSGSGRGERRAGLPVAGYFACGWARTTVLMILSAIVWRLVSHSGNSQPT